MAQLAVRVGHRLLAICSNVLNVIDSDDALNETLEVLACAQNVAITVYEGDKSGIGRATKDDCWQRNERLATYLPKVQRYFPNAHIRHGMITTVI